MAGKLLKDGSFAGTSGFVTGGKKAGAQKMKGMASVLKGADAAIVPALKGLSGGTGTAGSSGSLGLAAASSGTSSAGALAQALQQAYAAAISQNRANYETGVTTARSAYDGGAGSVNAAAEKALREAYISRMLGQRDLTQQLTAQGISGGAAETTLARLLNGYTSARSEIERSRSENLTELSKTFLAAVAKAQSTLSAQDSTADQKYGVKLAQAGAQTAETSGTAKTASRASSYQYDADWLADYVAVQSGKYPKAYLQKNAGSLIDAYGLAGYKALLSSVRS